MAAIITGTRVGSGGHPVEVRRQVGVSRPGATAASAKVSRRQIPTGPNGLAQVIAVVQRLDGALEEVMVVVVGVGGGPGGVAELHLVGSAQKSQGGRSREEQGRCGDKPHQQPAG